MMEYTESMNLTEAVKLTQELVRIPSHKDVEDRESAVAEFIYNYCKENGLEVEYQVVEGKRRNVIARLRGNGTGKNLMFSGHIDTVPPYDMEYDDPYCADIVDGYLLGRGCNDMKGAVACMITAMVNIKNKGKVLNGDIILAAVVGEEEKSDGTAFVVKSGITADGAIEGEPSNYGYSLGHRGLEWIEIKFIGKRAHGCTPELGINAISKASKFIQKIETELMPKLKERKNEWMGPDIMNFGYIHGGAAPSFVADNCVLQFDRRYTPGETVDDVIKDYQDIIDELKAEDSQFNAEIIRMEENLMDDFDHAPLIAEPDSQIAKTVYKAIKEFIGKEPEIVQRGWTDAGLLSTYGKIPTVVTGPGNVKWSHAKDEKIPVADLVNYVEIYTNIAEQFCI
ncbi:MAG: M20 family metallopeptidase [Sedimentibacter sp.]|nr:M20 family metallopeptidase [Sedimentibacter sp.]HNZ82837.1 M20 family metallopeptidase [Sedimentibacter sp.]HOG63467.1 M20 family metallopeptidase [Sedimentibacter sp.]